MVLPSRYGSKLTGSRFSNTVAHTGARLFMRLVPRYKNLIPFCFFEMTHRTMKHRAHPAKTTENEVFMKSFSSYVLLVAEG